MASPEVDTADLITLHLTTWLRSNKLSKNFYVRRVGPWVKIYPTDNVSTFLSINTGIPLKGTISMDNIDKWHYDFLPIEDPEFLKDLDKLLGVFIDLANRAKESHAFRGFPHSG